MVDLRHGARLAEHHAGLWDKKEHREEQKHEEGKKNLTRVSAGSGLSGHKGSDWANREHSCVAVWISTSAFRLLSRLITGPFCKRNHTKKKLTSSDA